MTVRGSCSCYGHADSCKPAKPEHANIQGMVHGTCECEHHTTGHNCELCEPLYNDMEWKPATGKNKNECKSKFLMFTKALFGVIKLVESSFSAHNRPHTYTLFFLRM